jgi:hypothetical protein
MHEFTKLVYRVSEIDVTRAKNQVRYASKDPQGSSVGLSAQLSYEWLVEEAGEDSSLLLLAACFEGLKVCWVLQCNLT